MMIVIALLGLMSMAYGNDGVSDIASAIRSHVAADTGFSDVDVDEIGFAAQHGCEGSPQVHVDTLPGEQYRGQTQFKVRFIENGVLCGRFSVPARVTVWREVPVAERDFRLGETISTKTGRVASADIKGVLVDVSDGDWIAARTIRAGQPVTARYAKRKPAATTGETVSIVAQFGGLKVKAEGRMLTNAYLGEWVRVANLATDTVVQGKLVAPGMVQTGGRR